MTSAQAAPVLIETFPASRLRDAALVVGGTGLLALCSQILIPLWFTPVPLSMATFAVLLLGTSLGPTRGALSVALYIILGLLGLPVFAEMSSGWHSASFGYILGYLAAALLVGTLARHRADRRIHTTLLATLLGSLTIYALGVPWLMVATGVDLAGALVLGVVPFLFGDAIKAVAASLLLPGMWKVVGSSNR